MEELKKLLYSDEWPIAVPDDFLCGNTEEEKINRAKGIIDLFTNIENMSFLDFGCGEGYVSMVASDKTAKSIGYDIEKTGNLEWEKEGKFLLTTDFEKVIANGPYDVICLYDVLDHDLTPKDSLEKIHSVCKQTAKWLRGSTIIYVRCHPFTSRHGMHLYKEINKAYIQMVFSLEELKSLGFNPKYTAPIMRPIVTYKKWFEETNFTVVKETVNQGEIEPFFKNTPIVRDRIIALNKGVFPDPQMGQNFDDFILNPKPISRTEWLESNPVKETTVLSEKPVQKKHTNMTEKEFYAFDSLGICIGRQKIDLETINQINQIISDTLQTEKPYKFNFLGTNPIFMDLMEHPFIISALKKCLGNSFRLDHAFGVQQPNNDRNDDDLHGGPMATQGSCYYQYGLSPTGKVWAGKMSVGIILTEQSESTGGFCYIPGSHKSCRQISGQQVHELLGINDECIITPKLFPGDIVVFPECLVHGFRKWNSETYRRVLYYMYTPGFQASSPYSEIEQYLPLAKTDMQRALMSPPFLIKHSSSGIARGTNNYRPPLPQ